MTISDIRRSTARALQKKVDGPANFARKVGMSASHISQLLGDNPTKNIGAMIARRFETAFGMPVGWLDVAHTAEELDQLGLEVAEQAPLDPDKREPGGYTPFSIDPIEIEIINSFRRATQAGKLSIRAAAMAAEKT